MGLRFSPISLLRQAFGQALDRVRAESRSGEGDGDPEARSRAADVIRAHAESHAALFERAARLRARAERLEREGTPSDSAANRAERAVGEVRSSLAELRSTFAASGGEGDLAAFDRELGLHYPEFRISEGS